MICCPNSATRQLHHVVKAGPRLHCQCLALWTLGNEAQAMVGALHGALSGLSSTSPNRRRIAPEFAALGKFHPPVTRSRASTIRRHRSDCGGFPQISAFAIQRRPLPGAALCAQVFNLCCCVLLAFLPTLIGLPHDSRISWKTAAIGFTCASPLMGLNSKPCSLDKGAPLELLFKQPQNYLD